jgi:hypothetical protein
MTQYLSERIDNLFSSEISELEEFAEFLIFKRSINNNETFADDISTKEISELISNSDAFKWLESSDEDVYSISDGVPVQW